MREICEEGLILTSFFINASITSSIASLLLKEGGCWFFVGPFISNPVSLTTDILGFHQGAGVMAGPCSSDLVREPERSINVPEMKRAMKCWYILCHGFHGRPAGMRPLEEMIDRRDPDALVLNCKSLSFFDMGMGIESDPWPRPRRSSGGRERGRG